MIRGKYYERISYPHEDVIGERIKIYYSCNKICSALFGSKKYDEYNPNWQEQ
jgi:hypothetical protein